MRMRTKIILVIIAFCIIGLIFKVNSEKDEYRKIMKEAVYIEDTDIIDESLTDRFVIISGTPEMTEGAYDPDFDIHFDYPVIYRISTVLSDTGTGGNHATSWEKVFRGNKYTYGSADFCGEAKIGAYTISGDVLKFIFKSSPDEIVTEEMAKRTGWTYYKNNKYVGTYLLSRPLTFQNDWDNWLDRGLMKITYDAKSQQGIPCTVFGYLGDGGHIIPTTDYEVKYVHGIMNKDEFLKKY